ncbi:nuclear GTPase SLIP-GC [Ahaetulla prasina]|uniref:nuclear GTPase SLIP-GC n=1 Tax=Ahaetulla prasina TaxID=499056 RepID=UPI002649E248|nr:nuclear GTPase SLIP-GC [Ahaetulla prasina]
MNLPGRSWSGREGESPETALPCRPDGEGQRLSHLRSIGSWAPVPGVSQIIHFSKTVTLFGRNIRVVDYCLNSPAAATTTDLNYISRIHARIIRTDSDYVLVDSSLTGVYVNDIRIKGRVNLREGDTVTFGHPAGKNLLLGSHTRQPNSPFYFLFEHCDCGPDQMQSVYGDRRNFPQLLKCPDMVSAEVSHPGNPNLAFAHNVSRPQMTLPGVLPGPAPLASSITQCDHQSALAPSLHPALPAPSPVTAPLPTPSQNISEQSRFSSSSCPPLRVPCRQASQVLRSASPDYTLLEENSFAATEASSLQENSESGDSASLSSESALECDRPHPQWLSQHEDAGSDPERGRKHPLRPSSTYPEVSEAADQGGSPKTIRASGSWEETLQLTPVFTTETGGISGCAPSVFGPETPALSGTDQGEEQAKINLCPSMEEVACAGESFASEPDSPAEEMEGVEFTGSCAQAVRGSMDECKEHLVEKHSLKTSEEEEEEEEKEAEGGESRAVALSSEIQRSELGHIQRHDSAKGTAEICFSSGEEPMSDSSTKILSQEKLDSERRNVLLPSRNSSRGTQNGGVDYTVDSPENVAASEEVEMEPPTDAGLEGVDGHLRHREFEPEISSVIPADAEGVCNKASMVDVCAEMGIWTDGVKPGEMEVTTTESSKDVDPNQRLGTDGADSKADVAKEMLLQKLSQTLILDKQFKGGFFQGEKKDWSEASDTTDENLHSKDLPETREGGGRALGTDRLQARPVLRENIDLAGAIETSIPGPPENLGELISEQCLFQSSKNLFGNQVGEVSEMEEKDTRSAESSNNSNEVTADCRLQDADKMSKSDGSFLGIVEVPVVGLSGGETPSYRSGRERQHQGDSKDPSSQVKRSKIDTSAAAAANEEAANQHREAEGSLEKEPTGLVEQEEADCAAAEDAAADASLTRSPTPKPPEWSSLGSAGRKGDSSREGLEEGRIPHLGDCSLVDTQLPSPKSQREAGERSVSDSNHLLGCQYVTEDERFTSLNEEGPVKTTMGEEEEEEEEASPVAATQRDFDPSPLQVGSLNGPCSSFSSSSSYVRNQLQCPTEVDPQELKSDIVELENLENGLEVKSQGADVGGKLLCLEDPLIQDGASEEPEAPLEQISLPGPGEPGQDVFVPEESSWSNQIAKNLHCMKARGSTMLPLPSVGLLQPGAVAVNLSVEPTDNSAEALQLLDGNDGLHWQIPASEAEKEETGQFGPSKRDGLHRRRDTFDPAEQRSNATKSWEAFREPTEESANRGPHDLAIQEASAGLLKGREMQEMSLDGQTSSRRDQGSPVRAASSTAGTKAGGPSLSRRSRKRASETPEEPGGEEMELDPVNLAGWPEKSPSESASESAVDGRVACKDQGFIENTHQGLVQESWPMAGRLPGQPDRATMASPLGEAVKELPASEMSSSPRSGKGEYAQKAGMMHQDNRLTGQESACQLGNGPEASAGYRGDLGCSEPCETLLQEEEKLNSSSPRKRLQNEELDLEGAACHPKKLCRENFALVWCSASDPAASPVVPPPSPLEESIQQFGKTIEKFLDQCRNQIPLCSDPMERNEDVLAQMVRNYFKSNIYSNEPATENGKTEEFEALSSETIAAKGIDCRSEGGAGDPRESPGCDGPGSPEGAEEGAQIPEDAPVSPGGWSAGSSSSAKEGKGLGSPGQEDIYYFEPLGDSGCSFPAESPKAEPLEGPLEEDPDTSSPLDITASCQSYELSPSPRWSNSDDMLDGASEGSGTLSEAEWYSPSEADCYEEDSGTSPDAAMLWQEDSQAAPWDTQPEPAHPLSPSEQEAPGRWLQRGELDGGDRPDSSACREDSGKTREEKAAEGDRMGMPAEGSLFPQGGPGGSPDQDNTERTPSEPFPQSPWESNSQTFLQSSVGRCDPPLKTELTDEESDGQDCRRNASPPPSGRNPVASAQAADNPEEGPSTPHPNPTPAEGFTLLLVKEEPVQEDEPLPSVGAESSLSALCPSQDGERASPLGKGFGRPECGAGKAVSREAPWIPGASGCFPVTDACSDRGPRSALPLQGDGSPLAGSPLADTGLHSQVVREEKKQLWPLSYPTSSPPSLSVCQHSHVPKTSAEEQREGPWHPADFGSREPGIPCQSEEAGLAEPSDAECLHVAAAVSSPALPEFKERVSLFRDPPARTESYSSCLRERTESHSPTKWASSEQDVAFQLQECQSVLAEILQALSSVEGVDNAHVEKWRDQIAVLQKATKMPQTHIAVVGNTGAGKSCLLNALLDEEAMLPTSAMRACTAVVVEISSAAEGSPYEAEVEFLSREEKRVSSSVRKKPCGLSQAADNPEEGPSTPHPNPTPAEGFTLLLVKEEPVQEDEPLPSVGAESSLSALCPSQDGERASPLGKGFGRPECGAGKAVSREAPWIPGASGCFPVTDACSDRGPRSALPLQGDGSPLAGSPLADTGLHSQRSSAKDLGIRQTLEAESLAFLVSQRRQGWLSLRMPSAYMWQPPCRLLHRLGSRKGLLSRDPPARTESYSSCLRERTGSHSPTKWASSEQDVAFQLQECQSVLAEILQALSSVEGVDNAHVEKWRDQIAVLQKATKMPQTHIAVVGNTGAGKSCLLNALLDEEAMLPTSAMRACTAVVVEISSAAEGSPYEAEVEFLSREEWNMELEALLEDMKDKAGILKKRCPDRKTEAGAAYSRVKAVYGRVDELEKLEDKQGVTQHLGTVKHICADTAADFRMKIEKFIDSRTDNLREMKGGEFWPIVKCVRIRVAKAEVLRTGAVLVDLPGTRDSNAARDTTAREYLKDCNAVWVTASITRAVDDKTAKELLSANFRRQLFMDGLYGSLAFICTKTDSFSITDIVRDLNLQDKIRPLEEELQELEHQRTQAEIEKKHLYAQLQQQQQPVRKGSAAGDSVWLQRHDILEKEFKICALQREKDARLRAISLICVQARNEFSKQRILMDFSAGLQEVSRRAEGEEDGEEEMDEGDSAGEQPVSLEVFTVSSTEYLKLGGKLLCNGQPQVFHDVKDTEIPRLKKFAMDTALKHSMVATEKVIRDVARVLSQMVNYLNSQRTEANAHQAQVREMLQQALHGLPGLLQGVLTASSQDLRQAFEALILGSLQNGAEKAKQLSEAIVKGWGSPMFGYPHVTYRAICNHRGVYTSPRYQSVDFNKELAVPILKVISVAWNEVFSSKLVSSIEAFTAALLDQLSSFFRGLKKKLHPHGPVAKALRAIYAQQMEAARARLLNFTLDQMTSITRKQRTVSRLLIPTIQAGMEPAYAACSQLSGPGYFRRMKEEMEKFIHQQKDAIFDSAVEKMRQQLDLVQLSICCSLQTVAQELTTSIRMQFEPLLRPVQKNKEILPELQRLCAKVDKICQRSGVDYVLPMAPQPEDQPPGTEAKPPASGDCVSFSAASMDVRVGALSLPRLMAIEVSKENITLTLAGDATKAALPLGSVSHCESCLPLGCLILHISAKAACEVCFQCRVHLPSPGLCSQEALVIREAAQDERQLPKLRDCLAVRLSIASWVQELSPQQGREKLVSLGVSCPGQQIPESAEPPESQVPSAPEPIRAVGAVGRQPPPPLLPWNPYGRKRAGEAVLPQLEKKTKLASDPWLPCSQGAQRKPTSSSAALVGSCSPEGAFRPDSPPCLMAENPDGEPPAVPSSAGLLWIGASQGMCRKPPSVTVKEEEADLPSQKTRVPRLL